MRRHEGLRDLLREVALLEDAVRHIPARHLPDGVPEAQFAMLDHLRDTRNAAEPFFEETIHRPEALPPFMEINRFHDFNAHWHRERFPDDPVYSGSGSSGQSSLVYLTELDLDSARRARLLEPVGHGHPSGADGSVTADLKGFDTALALVGAVMAERALP